MDGLMEAMARAISQSEREVAAAQSEATRKITLTSEEAALTGAALTRVKEHEAKARRRACIFLKAMRNPGGDKARDLSREDNRRTRGKEPAASRSQEAEEVTPPEHLAQQHTHPTRP
jgi:hypothetical protein